jgi:hypothetical protein
VLHIRCEEIYTTVGSLGTHYIRKSEDIKVKRGSANFESFIIIFKTPSSHKYRIEHNINHTYNNIEEEKLLHNQTDQATVKA